MSEPAFKAHLHHEREERAEYERDMLYRLCDGPRAYTALANGLFRVLARECDATTGK